MAQEPISHTFNNRDNPASANVNSNINVPESSIIQGNVDSKARLNGELEVSKDRQGSYLPASPSPTVKAGEAAKNGANPDNTHTVGASTVSQSTLSYLHCTASLAG